MSQINVDGKENLRAAIADLQAEVDALEELRVREERPDAGKALTMILRESERKIVEQTAAIRRAVAECQVPGHEEPWYNRPHRG